MIDQLPPVPPPGRPSRLLGLVQDVLFAVLLLLGVVRALLDGAWPASVLPVAGLLAAWYAAEQRIRQRLPVGVWLAVLSGLCLVAMWLSGDFAWVAFAVFVVIANSLPPVPAVASIAVFAVATGGLLVVRWPRDGHWAAQLIGPIVGAAVAAALVGVSRFAAAEAAERQRLLEELLATRDDLAVAHLEAGARAERERLTREIHDTLAQGFTSVVLAARRARHAAVSSDDAAVQRELLHIEDLGHDGVEQARRLVRQLPPAELDDRPLPLALQVLACAGANGQGPEVDVRVDGEPRPLSSPVEVALLRVAQEGVANARRHAHADRVVVTLTYQRASVSLDVADDGVGFDPATSAPGYGLASMKGRIDQLGGNFAIESDPHAGTAINATLATPADDGKPRA